MMIKPILRSEAILKNLNVAEVDKIYAKLILIYCRQAITTVTTVKVEFLRTRCFPRVRLGITFVRDLVLVNGVPQVD